MINKEGRRAVSDMKARSDDEQTSFLKIWAIQWSLDVAALRITPSEVPSAHADEVQNEAVS